MNKTTIVHGKFILVESNTQKKIVKDGAIYIKNGLIEDIENIIFFAKNIKDELIGSETVS